MVENSAASPASTVMARGAERPPAGQDIRPTFHNPTYPWPDLGIQPVGCRWAETGGRLARLAVPAAGAAAVPALAELPALAGLLACESWGLGFAEPGGRLGTLVS